MLKRVIIFLLFVQIATAIEWQHLKYNTLVSIGIDIADPELFDGTYPSANYFLELSQGVQERAWSTGTTSGSNFTVVATNFVNVYTNLDTRPYSWTSNLPLTNLSGVVTGYTTFTNSYYIKTTNSPQIVTNSAFDGFTFNVAPMTWDIDRTSYDANKKYIISLTTNVYTNITVSITNSIITTNTTYTTNTTVQDSMAVNDYTWDNAIDHFINRDLYTKVIAKTYTLPPYFVDEGLVNSNGNFSGLTNAAFPKQAILDNTNTVYGYTSGEMFTGRTVWEIADANRSGLVGIDYTASGSTSKTHAIMQMKTFNPITLPPQTRFWRYADENNNGTFETAFGKSGWWNWTANTYNNDRYTRSTNWLAKYDVVKSLKWIDREATMTWTQVTNSSAITGGSYISAGVSRRTGTYASKYGGGSDKDIDIAKADASDDWDADSWSGGNSYTIEASSTIKVDDRTNYVARLENKVVTPDYTNDWSFPVELTHWSTTLVDNPDDVPNDLGTGWTNAAPHRNEMFSVSLPAKTLTSVSEIGTRTKPSSYAPLADPFIYARYGFEFQLDNNSDGYWEYRTYMWEPDPAANIYLYEGVSYHSWEEAKALAEANLRRGAWIPDVSAGIVNGTFGVFHVVAEVGVSTNRWTASIRKEAAEGIILGLDTNKTKTIDWYVKAAPLATNQFMTVEGNDIYWPTSFWYLVESDDYAADIHSATSSPLGSVTNMLPWCVDPQTLPGKSSGRGWKATSVKGIVKYDYEYCTNSL